LASLTIAAGAAIANNADGLSLSGTVVNSVTGAPVPYARVQFGLHLTLADRDGAFRFSDVKPGEHSLGARKQGFALPEMDDEVQLTESREKYVLRIMPFAKILGRVVDKSGDPIVSATVMVMAKLRWGHSGLRMVKSVETDDRGQYRVWDLAPGSYLIYVSPPTSREGYYGKSEASGGREGFAPVFFGGSNDPAQATRIKLTAGDEAQADVRVELKPGHAVRGRVDGLRPDTLPLVQLSSGEHDLGLTASSVEYSTGRFEIRGVPDGNYRLRVYQKSEGDQVLYGEQNIKIDGRDLEDVKIGLTLAPTVVVRSRVEPPGWPGGISLFLVSLDPFLATNGSLGSGKAVRSQEGRIEIRGCRPWQVLVESDVERRSWIPGIASRRAGGPSGSGGIVRGQKRSARNRIGGARGLRTRPSDARTGNGDF
jgi:hypothetical protein